VVLIFQVVFGSFIHLSKQNKEAIRIFQVT